MSRIAGRKTVILLAFFFCEQSDCVSAGRNKKEKDENVMEVVKNVLISMKGLLE